MATEIAKLYTTREVAEMMRLSHEYLRKLARLGRVPARKIRRKFYFTEDQVKTLLGQ